MSKLSAFPFQVKLALVFALVLLIPTVIFALYSIDTTRDRLIEDQQSEHLGLLRLKAASVDTLLENAHDQLLFLANTPTLRSYANALDEGEAPAGTEDSQMLMSFLDSALVNYKSARIYDLDGDEVLKVDNSATTPVRVPDAQLEAGSQAPFFMEGLELANGQIYTSGLTLSLVRGRINQPHVPVIYYSTPLFAESGNRVGVIVLETFATPILSSIRQTVVDSSHLETFTIIDADGSYLLGVELDKLYGSILNSGSFFSQDFPGDAAYIASHSEGAMMASQDRPDTYIYFVKVKPTRQNIEWTIIISEPSSTVVDELNTTRRNILALSVVALMITTGLAFVLTRIILRPVRRLSDAADEISRGRWEADIPVVTSRDEIGRLSTSFRQMTQNLEERTLELEVATIKAMEASRIKSEFLSTMSHELRTPLNAIIGFTELVLRGLSGPLTEKQEHQLSRVHANSVHLLGLINDILDLSKIEAGRMEIFYAPYAPRDMLKTVTDKVSNLAEEKGLQFNVTIDPNLPESVVGDRARVEQVVINLLSNAFKFTEHGEVELAVKHLADTQKWQMAVRDTGVGIAPHAIEYIFDEFRQADGTSRRAYGGTGLGLAICRNLCRLMGGEVNVKSELDKGSTFTVTLPLPPENPNVKVENPVQPEGVIHS
ncbi:MAG: HAMP domain-containing protein [Anaerolineae bacterium]|nr:HAMP domain-containing protein [Anaerolineae bacterium]